MSSVNELRNIFESRNKNSKSNKNMNKLNTKKSNVKDKLNTNNVNISKKEEDDDFVLKKSQTFMENISNIQNVQISKQEINQINKKEQDSKNQTKEKKEINDDNKKKDIKENIKENKLNNETKKKEDTQKKNEMSENKNIKENKINTIKKENSKCNINNNDNKSNEKKNIKSDSKDSEPQKGIKEMEKEKEILVNNKEINKDKLPEENDLSKNKSFKKKEGSISRIKTYNAKNLKDKIFEDSSENLHNITNDGIVDNQNRRKYNNKNINGGKKFFKDRYLKEKINEIDETIKNMTNSGNITKVDQNNSFNSSSSSLKSINNNYERESEGRKCQTEFLLIVEKAIISFNLKKYQESFNYLQSSGIINDLKEFGEFLLVVSGFDKVILGEFLAKEKPPNDQKDVLNSFISSIDMNYNNYSFLDCLRFLLTRLILPKDANLILVIMDTFSQHFYNSNEIIITKSGEEKKNEKFLKIFNNTNSIYLLVSTILALNTMFTRKDIKNMNVIKKDEFKSMNKDIDPSYINDLYDDLKKKPISLSDDYNEEIYKKLSTLVLVNKKENIGSLRRGISTDNIDNNEVKNTELNNNENKNNKKEEKEIENTENKLEKINTEKLKEQKYYELIQDFMDLDIVRNTLRGSYYRKKSFSMNTNLLIFNEDDKKLLSKPNKFYLIQGNSKPTQREFIIFENFKKLHFDKTIDISKQKYKKFIEISDINDVYVGINHGDNIKKYIKAYPQEEKFSNNFISIVYNNHKEQIDIKNDDLSLSLLWFKAMKSLLIQTKTKEENEKKKNVVNKLKDIRDKLSNFWEEYILTHWDNYGKYVILKSYEKYNYFRSILIQPERQAKIDLLDEKKVFNAKTIEDFLKELHERCSRNQNNRLEYYEFFCLCYIGFPHKLRNKIWRIFIENNLGLSKNIYLYYQADIIKHKYDFSELVFKYLENPNIQLNPDYNLNKIIIDIIKSRFLFSQEIMDQQIDENELMQKVYNITITFNLIRSDIPYNKGIVSIAFFFLLAGLDEINCFICLTNLICSRNTLKYYIGDTKSIQNTIEFFNILLKMFAKKVYDHLNKLEINPELYLIPWFEKLFTQALDYNILLHVFDLYLVNGEYIIFQTAITIIKLVEEDLLNLTISEVFKILKILPKKYTELDFFEKFKAYNNIREEFISWNKNILLSLQQQEIDKLQK